MALVLFCQACGAFQELTTCELQPCARCGGTLFHDLHPRDRDPRWTPPAWLSREAWDMDFLRSLRIAVDQD